MQRIRYLALLVFLVTRVLASAQDDLIPFGAAFAPTFTFTETYRETVKFSNSERDFVDQTLATLSCRARVSMEGLDLSALTIEESLFLSIGNLSLELILGDGIQSFVDGMNVIRWQLEGTDPDTGDTVQNGCTVTLRFNSTELIVQIASTNVPDDFNIMAPDEAGVPDKLEKVPLTYYFTIGPYGMGEQMCYAAGTSALYDTVVNGEEFTDLADVSVSGELDLVKPVVKITQPESDAVVDTQTIEVGGTVTDNYVAVGVDVSLNDGPFVPATLGNNETWRLTGVTPIPGRNTLVARAEDESGNMDFSSVRTFVYTPLGRLTVTAEGNAPGKISGNFISTLQYRPARAVTAVQAELVVGQEFTLVATPAAGARFDHWTSSALLSPAQESSERLDFIMTEDLMLTAHFVINPFTSVHGTYAGLLTSTEFGGGGFLSGKVTRQGAFSLKAILGKLTLPIKGRFSLEGQFSGRVVVKGTSYQVDLTLNVTGDGARTITGSIVGGNRSATLAADLSPFQRRSAPVSANLAGTFNCLLPANPNVADPNYPIGLGFARFTVLPSGMAKFSGRIADGSAVSGGAPLSGEGRLPFYSSLYGGGGSISGWMDFDPGQIDHDVSGTLNWSKPRSSRTVVHSEGFSGQSDLFGARIATIASFLNSPRQLTLQSPTKDPNPLNVSIPFTFSRNGQTTVSIPSGIPIESIALKVRPKSGLFSGRLVERNAVRKINGMIVGSKLNRAGGFVLRNGYSTALEIEPGVVE